MRPCVTAAGRRISGGSKYTVYPRGYYKSIPLFTAQSGVGTFATSECASQLQTPHCFNFNDFKAFLFYRKTWTFGWDSDPRDRGPVGKKKENKLLSLPTTELTRKAPRLFQSEQYCSAGSQFYWRILPRRSVTLSCALAAPCQRLSWSPRRGGKGLTPVKCAHANHQTKRYLEFFFLILCYAQVA